MVLASGVGIALGLSPIPFYEIGLIAPELARAFHWGIGTIMAGVFFMMCGSLIASPAVGFLADRFGARRVALTSIVCFSICVAGFSAQTGYLPFYYANWFLMALTGAGTLPITWTRTINESFDRRKGLALGLALAGTGLSGFLLKPATAAVIVAHGWRAAFLFLGALPLLIALPLTLLFFRPVARPAAVQAFRETAPARETASGEGRSFREAIGDWRLWIIGLGILPVAFAISGPIANLESILKGHGVDHETIVRDAPLLGLAVVAARVVGGWLVDRIWAPAIAVGLFTLAAAASWSLVNAPPAPGYVLFGVLGVGLAAGLEFDLMSFLIARYFGPRAYGGIYGTMYAFFALGSGIAPLVYGRAFDATGNFTGVVTLGAWAMLVGGVLLLVLGPYRYRPTPLGENALRGVADAIPRARA
jgi:MFS family permease